MLNNMIELPIVRAIDRSEMSPQEREIRHLRRVHERMIRRCYNPKSDHFKTYGQRGISVCSQWLGPGGLAQFIFDMGDRPPGYQIDRIDIDGNYCPTNCRWASPQDQRRNTTRTRWIEYNGELVALPVLAERNNIPRKIFQNRLDRGWPLEKILQPVIPRKPRTA